VATNPRIEDLRRRIDREPGSRLFAQLAEELRKDGDLDESIRICREGLARHPGYPSARMTLGRALQDKGDLQEARTEFEAVVKGAPDNILAGRLLAECLEGLGELAAARGRYEATLAVAPGDRLILARLEGLKGAVGGPAAVVPQPPTAAPRAAVGTAKGGPSPGDLPVTAGKPAGPPPPVVAEAPAGGETPVEEPEPAPIPVSMVDEPMELEQAHERGQSLYPLTIGRSGGEGLADADEPPPIPVSAVEEEGFELEASYEAPVSGGFVAAEGIPEADGAQAGGADSAEEFDFDLESASTAPVPVIRLEPAVESPLSGRGLPMDAEDARGTAAARDEGGVPSEPPVLSPEPPAAVPVAPAPVAQAPRVDAAVPETSEVVPEGEAPAEIASTTLAELYFAQGLRFRAADVYRQILRREPDNARARTRLGEIEAQESAGTEASLAPPAAAAVVQGAGGREAALQRTIARLETFLAVVRRPRQ